MSARHIGLPPGSNESPGWTFTIDNTGLFTLKTTVSCHIDNIMDLAPPIGTPHPRFSFAVLDEISGAREEGDLGKIDCVYKGQQPGKNPEQESPPVYQLVASTREEPLELHDRYKDVSLDDLATIKEVIDGKKKPSAAGLTGRALELLTKKLRGQESYLRKAVVWRETTTSSAGFNSLGSVGFIDNPPGAPSNSPGNYLLLSMDQKKQGSAWERVREWMASGKEGWDAEIYTA